MLGNLPARHAPHQYQRQCGDLVHLASWYFPFMYFSQCLTADLPPRSAYQIGLVGDSVRRLAVPESAIRFMVIRFPQSARQRYLCSRIACQFTFLLRSRESWFTLPGALRLLQWIYHSRVSAVALTTTSRLNGSSVLRCEDH